MKVVDGLPCGRFTENLSNQFCHVKVLSEEKIKIPTNVHAIQVHAYRHLLLILDSNGTLFVNITLVNKLFMHIYFLCSAVKHHS